MKSCYLFLLTKTTTTTGNTIAPLDKVSFQLQNYFSTKSPTCFFLFFTNIDITSSEMHYTQPNSAHTHCLVSKSIHEWVQFFQHGGIQRHICFTSTTMLDAILPDNHLSATCNKAKHQLWLIGRNLQLLMPYHQHQPLILQDNIFK